MRHYAADILYSCSEFVTKNRDTLFDSLKSLCRRSDDAFVAQLFAATKAPPASGAASGAKAKPKRRARRRAGSRKQGLQVQPSLRTVHHRSHCQVPPTHCTHTRRPQPQQTVAKQFRTSLHELIESVRKTRPRFVRCIKSNEKATPRLFNTTGVLRQLRYAGVIAALNMRRAGYPSRCVTATHTRRQRERETERETGSEGHTHTN